MNFYTVLIFLYFKAPQILRKSGKGDGIFFLYLKGNYTATFDSPLVTFLMLTFGSSLL